MKNFSQKIKNFVNSTSVRHYFIIFLIYVVFIIICCFIWKEAYKELLFSFLGVVMAGAGTALLKAYAVTHEDSNKIRNFDDDNDIDSVYKLQFSLNGKMVPILYEPIFNDWTMECEIEDHPDDWFQLEPLIQSHFFEIMKAHENSYIQNGTMIRMKDYRLEGHKVTLVTERTTFYNDLVTNRAMDYNIYGGVSIRDIYEYGKYLTPLPESKLSNHLGVNAIIFTNDGFAIIPQRSANSTMSKHQITSSIAIGISENSPDEPYTAQELCCDMHLRWMERNLYLEKDRLQKMKQNGTLHIYFLGFGRLIYTGGKPQLYFAIVCDELNVNQINQKINFQFREDKNGIDANKKWCLVKRMEVDEQKENHLILHLHDGTCTKAVAEKSFYCNLWHIQNQNRIPGIPEWIYQK